jgi:tetratricopeptide (TPR) repeat protein
VAGAISGRITEAAAQAQPMWKPADQRAGIPPAGLCRRGAPFCWTARQADGAEAGLEGSIAAAEAAGAEGDLFRAADGFRAALKLAPERLDLWTRYTNAILRAASEDWEVQQRLAEDRTSGAINTYLRAVTPADRADAMALLGDALAARSEYKPAIRAYRASLELAENPQRREAYEAMLSEHGFRIVEHVVESDAGRATHLLELLRPAGGRPR